MIECLIMGDSIAVGVKMFRPECLSHTRTGITSNGWNKRFGNNEIAANNVIISLGTNDWEKADTYASLMNIRSKIKSGRVLWIEPNRESKPEAVQAVRKVADQFGDIVITNNRWQPDKIHPTMAGYKDIAERVQK
jgi:lysophospholipase L1-like esterase